MCVISFEDTKLNIKARENWLIYYLNGRQSIDKTSNPFIDIASNNLRMF